MKLDLNGLKIVWVGLLLSIIGSLCNGSGGRGAVQDVADLTVTESAAGTSVLGTIGGIIALVAFILVIVGLSKLKNVSPYFKKARNLQIVLLILAIVFVVVLAVVIAGAVIGSSSAGAALGGAAIGMAVVLIVFMILLLVFAIMYNTNLLKGCQQTAKLCENKPLANKFRKMRSQYITAIGLVVAGAIVMICTIFIFGATAAAGISLGSEDLQTLIAIVPGVILIVVGAIIMLVYTILLLVRMAILWKYDGKEISQQSEQTSEA